MQKDTTILTDEELGWGGVWSAKQDCVRSFLFHPPQSLYLISLSVWWCNIVTRPLKYSHFIGPSSHYAEFSTFWHPLSMLLMLLVFVRRLLRVWSSVGFFFPTPSSGQTETTQTRKYIVAVTVFISLSRVCRNGKMGRKRRRDLRMWFEREENKTKISDSVPNRHSSERHSLITDSRKRSRKLNVRTHGIPSGWLFFIRSSVTSIRAIFSAFHPIDPDKWVKRVWWPGQFFTFLVFFSVFFWVKWSAGCRRWTFCPVTQISGITYNHQDIIIHNLPPSMLCHIHPKPHQRVQLHPMEYLVCPPIKNPPHHVARIP